MVDSPFHRILHTNQVPTQMQCDAIRDFLQTPREEEAKLAAEVTRLSILLDAAMEQRDSLREVIHAHEALLSPLRRAPDDVLREIFLRTLPETRNAALSADEGPLLLASVCKRWKQIVFKTPRLWAAMHIVVPIASDRPRVRQLAKMARAWLKKSGVVPLVISMKISSSLSFAFPQSPAARTASPLLPALLSVSRRWKNVQLVLSTAEEVNSLSTSLSAADVPLLEHLHLLYYRGGDLTPGQNLPQVDMPFLQTPSLRSFFFGGHCSSLPLGLAWENLLHVKLIMPTLAFDTTVVFPFGFLEQCQVLQTLEVALEGHQISIQEPPSAEPIVLPALTSLKLTMTLRHRAPDGRQIFELMQTPALASLEVRGVFANNVQPFFAPIPFLRSLHLNINPLTTDDLVGALDTLTLLEDLHLTGEPSLPPPDTDNTNNTPNDRLQIDPNLLAVLLPSPASTNTRCPALKRLKLSGIIILSDLSIVQFLTARPALTHFTCAAQRKQQLDVAAALRSAGVDVGVGDNPSTGVILDLSYKDLQAALPRYSPLEGTERAVALNMGIGLFPLPIGI
ncbi:hypothetical protein C8F01DRAFT_1106110 [Mycena amicta]|nr:hypothetical protein C8F01DRAFT_1106110 [Mycena amicta]